MSPRTVFNHYDDSPAVVEISHRKATPLPRATTTGFDDQGVVWAVRRARDTSEKREIGDGVGSPYKGPGNLIRVPPNVAMMGFMANPA